MKRLLTLGKVSRPTTSHLPNQLTRLTKTQLSRPFSVQPLRRPNGFVQRLNQIDPTKVIWTLIGTNGAIFLTWTYAKSTYEQFGDPKLLKFMYKHFTSSELAIDQGRLYTLLTSTFSHQDLSHFGINMFVLYSMGLGVLEAIGTSRFLLLYTGAGLFASLTTLAYKRYLVPLLEENKYGRYQERKVSSLGASGSIMGLTSFFACAFPRATFLVFFIIPVPAYACVGLFAAYDIYLASSLNNGIIDSAAHVGGAAYGLGYYFLRVRPLLRAGRWRL